jgi:hypothetical protein
MRTHIGSPESGVMADCEDEDRLRMQELNEQLRIMKEDELKRMGAKVLPPIHGGPRCIRGHLKTTSATGRLYCHPCHALHKKEYRRREALLK